MRASGGSVAPIPLSPVATWQPAPIQVAFWQPLPNGQVP